MELNKDPSLSHTEEVAAQQVQVDVEAVYKCLHIQKNEPNSSSFREALDYLNQCETSPDIFAAYFGILEREQVPLHLLR